MPLLGYLALALMVSGAILANTGTCEMADCEDLKTPISAVVTVLGIAFIPFASLLFLLIRWIVSPVGAKTTQSSNTD